MADETKIPRPPLGAFLGCGALSLVVTLVTAAISSAGVVTMGVAIVLLTFAWGVSVGAIVCADIIWQNPRLRWPTGVIAAFVSAFIFGCIGFWLYHARQSSAAPPIPNAQEIAKAMEAPLEDLRVSFVVRLRPGKAVQVSYLFRNYGSEAVLVSVLQLVEIVTNITPKNQDDNIDLCGDVDNSVLLVIQMSPLGNGTQVGNASKETALDAANSVSVNGVKLSADTPIEINSKKAAIVTATYVIQESHLAHHSNLVLCPLIGAIDTNNTVRLSVCRGMAEYWGPNGRSGYSPRGQYQILPSPGDLKCRTVP